MGSACAVAVTEVVLSPFVPVPCVTASNEIFHRRSYSTSKIAPRFRRGVRDGRRCYPRLRRLDDRPALHSTVPRVRPRWHQPRARVVDYAAPQALWRAPCATCVEVNTVQRTRGYLVSSCCCYRLHGLRILAELHRAEA